MRNFVFYQVSQASSCCSTLMQLFFGFSGLNNLYPGDIIPFTRRPLFLIIDSDSSHAFKAGLSKLVHDFRGIARSQFVIFFFIAYCFLHSWPFILPFVSNAMIHNAFYKLPSVLESNSLLKTPNLNQLLSCSC